MTEPVSKEIEPKRCSRCGAERCSGHDWAKPQETAICMAYDAFRICLGQQPRNFTPAQVQQWIGSMVS